MNMISRKSGGALSGPAGLGATLAFLLLQAPALAADLPSRQPAAAPAPQAASAASGWTYSINLYGWASGIDGRVRTLPPLPAANVNVGFDQLVGDLQGALMATAEARNGRFMIFTDIIATSIAPTLPPPEGYDSLKLTSGSLIGLVSAGYRLYEANGFSIDGMAGARGFGVRNKLEATVEGDPVSVSKTKMWADAVAGVRLRYDFTPKLAAIAIGFAGAGGSKYEWDVYGGLGYAFNETWSAFAGYRALKVDYKDGDFEYDVLQHGPILGVNVRF